MVVVGGGVGGKRIIVRMRPDYPDSRIEVGHLILEAGWTRNSSEGMPSVPTSMRSGKRQEVTTSILRTW